MFFTVPLIFSFNWFFPIILLLNYYYFYEFSLNFNLSAYLNESQLYFISQFFFTNPLIQYTFFFFNFLIFSNFGFFLNFIFFIPIDLVVCDNLEPLNAPQNLLNGIVLIHPIILFLGYNMLFCLFFFKSSLLSFYKSDWLKLSSLLLLKLLFTALILGSIWAGNELNWGGWWSWDIVEIGALLAFSISILFIHIEKNFLVFSNYLYLIHLFFLIFYISLHWGLLQSVHSFIDVNFESFSYSSFIFIFYFLFIKINTNKRNLFIILILLIICTLFYFIFINFLGIHSINYKFFFFFNLIFSFLFTFKFNFNFIFIFFPFFINFINFINYFKGKFNYYHMSFNISFISIFFISLGLLQKNVPIDYDVISFSLRGYNLLFNTYSVGNNFFSFNYNSFFFLQTDFTNYNSYNKLPDYYSNHSYQNQIIKSSNLFNMFYVKDTNLFLFDPSFILIFINV